MIKDHLDNLTNNRFIVYVSHTCVLSAPGGTEKYILEEIHDALGKGYNCFQIYSYTLEGSLKFGVNYNYKRLFTRLDKDGFKEVLEILVKSNNYEALSIHHLLDWDINYIKLIMQSFNDAEKYLYLHDFYGVCRSIFFLHNNKTYCKALELPANQLMCKECSFGDSIEEWQKFMSELFAHFDKIICPSKIIKDGYQKFYKAENSKIFDDKFQVVEHYNFKDEKTTLKKQPTQADKINIAFIGSNIDLKGWNIFKNLQNKEFIRNQYSFYCFGSLSSGIIDGINYIPYSSKFNRNQIVNLLVEKNIDIAFLWSTVPESYSFTLHEAYCANVPVITNPLSGNIFYKINGGHIYGKVLANAQELTAFLENKASVVEFICNNPANTFKEAKNTNFLLNILDSKNESAN